MHKNRFVRLMNTFSDYDMKQFERFIHSPYHNRSQQCVDVFNSLKYYLFEVPGINFTKAELCVSVFKDTKKINTLEVILSKLTKLAEGFIAIERLNRQPYMKQHLLLEELLERQNLEYCGGVIKQVTNQHKKIQKRGEEFYFEKYLIANDTYKYTFLNSKKSSWDDLNKRIQTLDEFYLIERLQLLCDAENYKSLYLTEYGKYETNILTPLLELDNRKENPMIILWRTILLTIRDEQELYFNQLLNLIDKYYLNIPKNELLSIYTTITNFCVRKVISGYTEYSQTLFTIYKKQAEQGVLSHGRYIPAQLIKNIVSLSATIGEFQWAEDFLESHINDVKPDINESVYYYNKAILAFYQKDFKTAMEHLNQTEKIDLSFELGRKTVLLRTYYELKEGLAFDALCKSFREYVHSQNGMPTRLKKAYVNFTTVIRKIERIRQQGEHGKILPLIEKINNYEFLTNKPWLIEKLKELPAYKRALAEETVDD